MHANATDRYLVDKINTATPAQLIAMLFEAGVRSMKAAQPAIEVGDRAESNRHLLKAQEIVLELRCSLNREAGDLARQLDMLYAWVHGRLVHANVTRSAAVIGEALAVVVPLQEAWREACLQPQPV